MHPLDSVWLKIIRAKEHIDFFYGEIEMFWLTKPEPYAFIPEDDTKNSEKVFRFKVNREPPIGWSIIVGDIAFNLRSALDHLAWQLARLTTQKPYSRTEFPIFDSTDDFKKSGIPKMRNIPPKAQQVIETLQPYHRGDWADVDHLWLLHEINRIDKHREITPCFGESIVKYSGMPGIYRSGRLYDGAVITAPIPEGEFQMKLGASIAFDVPTLKFPVDFAKINGIHKFIREEVIPRFSSFFPESKIVERIYIHKPLSTDMT